MRCAWIASVLLVVLALTSGSALAAPAKAKTKSAKAKAKAEPTAEPAPKPEDEAGSALASCKKHVESMLKESAETRFQGDQELRVQRGDGGAYDISGWVTSKTTTGNLRKADFNCHASRYGGSLWTTKTSLSFDR
jgi:hypothetical protein